MTAPSNALRDPLEGLFTSTRSTPVTQLKNPQNFREWNYPPPLTRMNERLVQELFISRVGTASPVRVGTM